MSKLKPRRERHFYEEPPIPETGAYRFRVEMVKATGDRINHWPGGNGSEEFFYEYEEDEPEETPEYSGKLQQCLSLKDINAQVQKHGLDEKKVFLTAALYEDHLCVEVVHITEQTQQEQLEEYKGLVEKFAKKKCLNKKQELENIQHQIEMLQRRANELNK